MMEKFRMVIDAGVCYELMMKGFNLIAQMPSELYEGRKIYVFANNADLEREILSYDPATYYHDKQEV